MKFKLRLFENYKKDVAGTPEEGLPHTVSEVICVHCGNRWVAVRPQKTPLIDLQCAECHNQGYVIETGEDITGRGYEIPV